MTLHPPDWKVAAACFARPAIVVSFRTTSGSFAAAVADDAGDDARVADAEDETCSVGAELYDRAGLGADEDGARVSLPASVP